MAPNANHAAIAAAGFALLTVGLLLIPSGIVAPTGTSFIALAAGITGLHTAGRKPRVGGAAMSIAGIVVGAPVFALGLLVNFAYLI